MNFGANDCLSNAINENIISGSKFKLQPPSGYSLPPKGYDPGINYYQAPSGHGDVVIDKNSERLQLLQPFNPWNGKDLENMLILIKVGCIKGWIRFHFILN